MAEPYFEMLTEHSGIPVQPFDPVGEVKRLRQSLAERIQKQEPQNTDILAEKPVPDVVSHRFISQPPALETMIETVNNMKKTLTSLQRTASRRRFTRNAALKEHLSFGHSVSGSFALASVAVQHLTAPQGILLETVNSGLTALGIVGIIFGGLCFSQGMNELSLGMLVSLSGLAVMSIGIVGRVLASRVLFG